MNNFKSILFFLILVSLSRLIPHPPNFTPLLSIAIFLPFLLEDKRIVLILPLAVLLITDFFLGSYNLMLWVYGSMLLISGISFYFYSNSLKRLTVLSLIAPSLFFIVTNFGVWIGSSNYSQDLSGLFLCYYYAIPFYAMNLISTLLFSVTFFIIFKLFINKKELSDASY
ncbi:MAG: hypothetical protein P8J93_01195 [SAR86 cluster bacterium]|jgi:hypothetical protein|nr:hypothetical protein [SAR86 cluster bacterium]